MKLFNRRFLKIKVLEIYHKINPKSRVNSKKMKQIAKYNYNYDLYKDVTILSPNCIAGEIYNILNLRFNTPTINTSFDRNDFILFCNNLKEYLECEPIITGHEKDTTPIMSLKPNGLKEIDIRFPHDFNDELIMSKWEERKKRINYSKIVIICDDRGLSEDNRKGFSDIKCYKSILFTSQKPLGKCDVFVKRYEGMKFVGEYQKKRKDGLYEFQHFFDFSNFICKEGGKNEEFIKEDSL